MAITTIINSRTNGGLTITRNGQAFQITPGELKYQGSSGRVSLWAVEKEGIKRDNNFPAILVPVAEIEVNGVNGFTTSIEVCQAIDILLLQGREMGVTNGEEDVVLDDDVDLDHFGWMVPTLAGGTIKYTTVNGDVRTKVFERNELSIGRVRRVWETGTTANLGIVIHF